MKQLIELNYKSIVDRGLISPDTTIFNFINKLNEEVKELEVECNYITISPIIVNPKESSSFKEELADVIMVCLNMAKHYDIDIEQEIKNKIEVNKKRALK